jgi:hypothetical protein
VAQFVAVIDFIEAQLSDPSAPPQAHSRILFSARQIKRNELSGSGSVAEGGDGSVGVTGGDVGDEDTGLFWVEIL